jgi:hypothetical protein
MDADARELPVMHCHANSYNSPHCLLLLCSLLCCCRVLLLDDVLAPNPALPCHFHLSIRLLLCSVLRCCRVLLLDDVLAPETLADEGDVENALLQNALSLAQQRASTLRIVIVLLPDIDLAVQEQQQQSGGGVVSAGGMSVGFGGAGAGGSMSMDTSASEGFSEGAAAAAGGAGGGGGGYMPGSGMTGDDTGTVAGQRAELLLQQQQRLPRIPRVFVRTLRRQLEEANAQGTVLAGTMRQVLQLLEAMVGKLQQPGSAAGVR